MPEVNGRDEIEDLEECARQGRAPRTGYRFRVRIDDDRFVVTDPVITGRQLLNEAGKRPVDAFLIFLKLRNGLLEEIRLDETVDLQLPGVEQFLTFKSDRSFRFELDGQRFEWGATLITGLTLKTLAGVDPENYGVWLEVRGGEDRPVGDDEVVDLGEEGLERFYLKRQEHEVQLIINTKPVLIEKGERTGREIKEAGIAAGLPIKPDFLLSLDGQSQSIGDTDRVKVHTGQRFTAVADDDNS